MLHTKFTYLKLLRVGIVQSEAAVHINSTQISAEFNHSYTAEPQSKHTFHPCSPSMSSPS